jgi:hypothetical protein
MEGRDVMEEGLEEEGECFLPVVRGSASGVLDGNPNQLVCAPECKEPRYWSGWSSMRLAAAV